MCRYGTSGHGLVGMVVMGGRLDLMILEVFSNLNNSLISAKWKCRGKLRRYNTSIKFQQRDRSSIHTHLKDYKFFNSHIVHAFLN